MSTMFDRQVDRTDADNLYTKDQICRTKPGMAHFAGTSPVPAVCGRCEYFNRTHKTKIFGYCQKYREIATKPKKNLTFSSATPACKYFIRRADTK